MAGGAELIADTRCGTGESPVWVAGEAALYWVDIPARRIHRWRSADGALQAWELPQMAGCMASDGQGGWVVAMEDRVAQVVLHENGRVDHTVLATLQHGAAGMRFNDGRCDRQGRLLAGTMVMDMTLASPQGRLYRLDERRLTPLLDGLITPNGMAFSPDGSTMYLSDSHPSVQAIWAFDYDTDGGTPSNRRLFVDMRPLPGRPDGAAIDADGCYWICGNDAGLVHRFTPQGRLDRSLAVPVKKPAMCAFGGINLDTLFVTSIRPQGVDLSDQPLAGAVFALRPGVRGVAEPVLRQPVQDFSCE